MYLRKQKSGPLALLNIDACATSKWRYKKTVAATVPKRGNLCWEYLISNECNFFFQDFSGTHLL